MRVTFTLLLLIALIMLVAICASAAPISIHAPCTQTLYPGVGAYSGNLAIVQWERGAIVVNVSTGVSQFIEGTWRAVSPGGCSGKASLLWNTGDYWQSVINLTASNGTPKWLVTPASPYGASCVGGQCNPARSNMGGLTYWKWNGTQYQTIDLLQPPAGVKVFELGTAVLDHDTAWVQLTQNMGWVPCDLNSGTCAWSAAQSTPPSGEGRQANINGKTYNVGIDYSHPNENGGPVWFWIQDSTLPTPTRPPAPTSTRTPTAGGPTRTATKTPTYNPCPPFCPPTATRTSTPNRTASGTPTASATATPLATRFTVGVTWTKPDGTTGVGSVSCSQASAADLSEGFWFFSFSNTELYVSILTSACSINGHVWVKAFGGTNVLVDIVIKDHLTGASWHYTNPQGQLFATQIDTQALPCGAP